MSAEDFTAADALEAETDLDPGISGPPPVQAVPTVRLGRVIPGGLAPAMLAIVERGVRRRPGMAAALRVEVELTVAGGHPPIRIAFGTDTVLVEDGPAHAPALRVRGELADLIGLLVAPSLGGVPLPFGARGRNAVSLVTSRRVRARGRIGLLRRLLALLRI